MILTEKELINLDKYKSKNFLRILNEGQNGKVELYPCILKIKLEEKKV